MSGKEGIFTEGVEIKKLFGQVIDTSDQHPYVVAEREFKTEAEALAYILGVTDGAEAADYSEMFGQVSDSPAEDE